jgi:hypothetical protein
MLRAKPPLVRIEGEALTKQKKRERVFLRVIKGALAPADNYAASVLRSRGYAVGDLLQADLTKPRNPKFNRLVHKIGQLVVANIEAFTGLDAHKAIKRLQLESGANCEELAILINGYGMVIQRVPLSFGFDSIDEAEYHQAAKEICSHIAKTYWPSLSAEKIEEMAECFIDE